MTSPRTYFVCHNGSDSGPFTAVQINRMKQRGMIRAGTLCRSETAAEYQRLDALFPHLRDFQKASTEKPSEREASALPSKTRWLIAAALLLALAGMAIRYAHFH